MADQQHLRRARRRNETSLPVPGSDRGGFIWCCHDPERLLWRPPRRLAGQMAPLGERADVVWAGSGRKIPALGHPGWCTLRAVTTGDAPDPADPRDPRGLRGDAPLLDAWLRFTAQADEGKLAPMCVPGHKQRHDLVGPV